MLTSASRPVLVRLVLIAGLFASSVACGSAAPGVHAYGPHGPRGLHAPAGGPLPLTASDELARVGSERERAEQLAVLDDGTLVTALVPDLSNDASTVVAHATPWHDLWRATIPGVINGMTAMPGGRTLVSSRLPSQSHQLTVLASGGQIVARAMLPELAGEQSCEQIGDRWLAADRTTVTALVTCGTTTRAGWVLVLSSDLTRVISKEPWTRQAVEAPRWRTLVDRRNVWVTGPAGVHEVLFRGDHDLVNALPHVAVLGNDDIAMATGATSTSSSSYRSGAFVARFASGLRWRTQLVEMHDTHDPVRVVGIGSLDNARIAVAVQFRGTPQIAGTILPLPALPFAHLYSRIAIVELDAATGRPLTITQLRTTLELGTWDHVRVRFSKHEVFVLAKHRIAAFTRTGAPIAPGGTAPVPPPITPEPLPAVATNQVTSLRERWSQVCGPRKVQKKNSPCRIERVAIGSDGTVVAGGGYYQNNQLGRIALSRRAWFTGLVAVFAPNGELRWHKSFGRSWHNGVTDVRILDDGRVVVLGHHGLGFEIDGVKLPERNLRVIPGQDMAWQAHTPFIAIFDKAGKLELLEDIDMLALGNRSGSIHRTCHATLGRADAGDAAWLLAQCTLSENADRESEPRTANFRLRIHGGTVDAPAPVALPTGLANAWPWALDARGHAFGQWSGPDRIELLAYDSSRHLPLVSDQRVSTTRGYPAVAGDRVWSVVEVANHNFVADALKRFVLVGATTALDHAITRTVVTSRTGDSVQIEALVIDDRGRPVIALSHGKSLTIGGQTLAVPKALPGHRSQGRAFVRFAADGSHIERIFVATAKRGACADPAASQLTSMTARGSRIAVTLSFGTNKTCGLRDEPSTVMVFDLGDK